MDARRRAAARVDLDIHVAAVRGRKLSESRRFRSADEETSLGIGHIVTNRRHVAAAVSRRIHVHRRVGHSLTGFIHHPR